MYCTVHLCFFQESEPFHFACMYDNKVLGLCTWAEFIPLNKSPNLSENQYKYLYCCAFFTAQLRRNMTLLITTWLLKAQSIDKQFLTKHTNTLLYFFLHYVLHCNWVLPIGLKNWKLWKQHRLDFFGASKSLDFVLGPRILEMAPFSDFQGLISIHPATFTAQGH